MAKEEAKPEAPAAEAAPKGPSKLPMIVTLANTVTLLAMAGIVIYTKVMFKRPEITEHSEREKIKSAPIGNQKVTEKGTIAVEPFTVNILPAQGDAQTEGKLHYATIKMVIEVRDVAEVSKFEGIKPVFMDKVIYALGKKPFYEVTSVQGRYVFRTEVIEIGNDLLKGPIITNVYFDQFLVQ